MKRLVVGVLVFSLWLVAGTAPAQDSWPTFQANAAHNGHLAVSFDPSTFNLEWDISLSAKRLEVQPVAAAEGMVFATVAWPQIGQDDLFALDAATGSILWSKNFGDPNSIGAPAYAGGRVYVQINDNTPGSFLYSFDAFTGDLVTEIPITAEWYEYYAPTIVDNRVFINGGFNGGMYGLSIAEEPELNWHASLGGDDDRWTPAVDGIYAYAYVGGVLSVLWTGTGEEAFSITDLNFESSDDRSLDSAPVLGGRDDILVIHDGRLISFDLREEVRNIRFEIDDQFGWTGDGTSGQPSVANGVIYAINGDNLEARNQDSGALLWSWIPPEDMAVRDTIIVTDSHALVLVKGQSVDLCEVGVYAISLTTHQGEELTGWTLQDYEFWQCGGHLAWSEGVLYVSRNDGWLSAFELPEYEQSPVVQFGFSSYSTSEGAGTATVVVQRLGSLDGAVTVTVQSSDGSAQAGFDYTPIDETVVWADGDGEDKSVAVPITDDGETEEVETVVLNLVEPTGGASIGSPDRALLAIYDNEVNQIRFGASGTEVSEGVGTVTVFVRRDGSTSGEVGVSFATADGTAVAGVDYIEATGMLSWEDGEGADKPVAISILDDGVAEDDKDFTLLLSEATGDATIGAPETFTITVVDDDGPRVEFSSRTYQVDETGETVGLLVQRLGGTEGAVSVDWATTDVSADDGVDYIGGSGTLEWDDDDDSDRIISLTVLDDTDTEGGETFQVTLSNVVGGETELGQPSVASVAIVDDEAAEYPLHSTAYLRQMRPRVAANSAGAAVAVWESWKQDDLTGWGVYGQRINVNGETVGDEFPVNQTVVGNQQDASVAMAADGSFLVVWEGATDTGVGIFGRWFDASGDPSGDEFLINTSPSGTQSDPRVALDGAGRAAVVWTGRDGSGFGVFGRAFDADKVPFSDEFVVNTTTNEGQGAPAVAGSSMGGFFAVWESYGQDDFDSNAVIGRRVATTGQPAGGEFVVNTVTDGDQSEPSVAAVSGGSYLVVWEDDTGLDGSFGSIRGRWYDSAANPTGDPFQINNYGAGDQGQPSASGESNGRAVVVWEGRSNQDGSGMGVFGRVLDESTGFASDEVQFNTYVANYQYQPEVACSESGWFLAAWTSEQQDGSGEGVYGVSWPLPKVALIFADGFESGDTTEWSN